MAFTRLTNEKVCQFIGGKVLSVWKILLIVTSITVSLGFISFRGAEKAKDQEIYGSTESTEYFSKDFNAINYLLTQRIAEGDYNYCQTEHCETITCSNIPSSKNSTEILMFFIDLNFQAACGSDQSVNLILQNCKFPSGKLQKNWLPIGIAIKKLEFNDCSLLEIEEDAFSSEIFQDIQSISFLGNRISSFRRNMFLNLRKLRALAIEDNVILCAESNLLEYVADSLESLTLNRALKDTEVLRNITGKGSLKKLEILSLRENSIWTIDGETILGGISVKSLYLERSEVRIIKPLAFEPMANTLEQLFLSGNNISQLPAGIFDGLVQRNPNFRLNLADNPWHCDCHLEWIKKFLEKNPSVFNDQPVCRSPEKNAFLRFHKAEFCDDSTSNEPEGESSTENNSAETLKVHCASREDYLLENRYDISFLNSHGAQKGRKLLSTVDHEFFQGYNNFSAMEFPNGSVSVKLPDIREENITLIWLKNSDFGSRRNDPIKCVKNVRGVLLLNDLEEGSSYTICLLKSAENSVNPLNCLALTRMGNYESRAWLLNKDKILALSLSSLTFLSFGFLSTLATYFVLRKYPGLLRGSERIILVKRRKFEALVLPKDLTIRDFPNFKGKKDDGYVTPLEPIELPRDRIIPSRSLRRKLSRTSAASFRSFGNSCVSSVEPTYSRLTAHLSNATKNGRNSPEIQPPPLPPDHPKLCAISSLNSNTESQIIDGPFARDYAIFR